MALLRDLPEIERTIFVTGFWHVIGFDECVLTNKLLTVLHKYRRLNIMGTAIEYQKLMTEIVYINLPGPEEPAPAMTGGELLHGFLAELHRMPNLESREHINGLCNKWNIRYRENRGK